MQNKYSEVVGVLKPVQQYMSENYAELLAYNENTSEKEKESQLKAYIHKYIVDYNVKIAGIDEGELINLLYSEMAEFSFLTDYLNRCDIEEININAWNDIKITYDDGTIRPTLENFHSPSHAIDIIRRLLERSKIVFDNSQPIVVGHLSDKIRITVLGYGVIDENIGVAVSIRIVNARKLGREDFINYKTATGEMLDFLSQAHQYGESMCFTGATSSGKTTLMSYILSTLPNTKRIFTIENGTREFNLIKKDKHDKVINNVIHTVTKANDDPKKAITMVKLLETGLTVNPDYICVAEMKSDEAFYAQEAARTGHAVSTTIHANGCLETYHRMVTLSKQRFNMDDHTLYNLVTEAFPIVAFCKRLEDNTRHIMELTECEILLNGERKIRPLWRFKITNTKETQTGVKIVGYYEKMNTISKNMQQRLLENGMKKEMLERYLKGVVVG